MAGKNRRKRRAHRARAATTTRSKARQRQATSARAIRASLATASDNKTAALSPSREPAKVAQGTLQIFPAATPAFGWLGRMPMPLLPGRVFFAMGRPVAGMACCVLQASVLGWLPAALWAAWAQARVGRKHRILAARLRSA
jgi:hypothetical protein